MADTPYLSELKIFSFNFAPRGWTLCNGQLLPINQNQALFALLGTTFGGNGQTTFGLPNLQGRVPMHMGNGFTIGEVGGETAHTVNISELPAHNHLIRASGNSPNANIITNNFFASNTGFSPYANTANEAMDPSTVSQIGGSQPHENMSPYLVLNIGIALQGIFPSHN